MTGEDYKPNTAVLAALKKVTLVAVIGPTGAGKSVLIEAAIERDPRLHRVLNNTSREPRANEREGEEFHFESREAMLARIERREYVQVAPTVLGDLYATAPENYHPSGVSLLPILAQAVPIFRKLPFKELRTIYVLPPDWDTWQARIKRHSFSHRQLERRFREAERSLVFALEDESTQLLICRELMDSLDDFIVMALGQPLPPRLLADQSHGRDIAADLLQRLREYL